MNLPTNKATMSSREIAELTGKPHYDVLKAVRKMAPAWEKVSRRKFLLSHYEQSTGSGGVKRFPMYELSKTECLYVATKFNDEARARLVLRWEELEMSVLQKPDLSALVKEASKLVGSKRKLAERIGINNSILTHINKNPHLVSRQMLVRIEAVCYDIIQNGAGIDADLVYMLMQVERKDVRLGLYDKFIRRAQ